MNKVEEDKKSAELRALNKKLYQEEQEKQIALKQKEAKDSFYQKLVDGFDVNVLIVGDSIAENGQGEKGWCTLLQNSLRKTYNNRVSFTNVSMGGNASYAGYVRTMALNDDVDYDLAIICYGQNDGLDGFSTNYESIIRAIRSKYPDCSCSIISILESSQREYTEKMTTIQSICEYYSIPVADTIAAFNNSGKAYDDLTGDGVHPNEVGQEIYFETVKAVIDDNVAASTGKMADTDVINADVHKFDNFVWYDASSDFERVDDTTFTISTSASGILGIDYTYESGDNKADIYVDGELFESPTVTFDYDFSQRHILVVSDDCTVKNEIKVVFNTKEQADGFKGMCFSWE
jgi:GDSL-family lipase/acylhydrolase